MICGFLWVDGRLFLSGFVGSHEIFLKSFVGTGGQLLKFRVFFGMNNFTSSKQRTDFFVGNQPQSEPIWSILWKSWIFSVDFLNAILGLLHDTIMVTWFLWELDGLFRLTKVNKTLQRWKITEDCEGFLEDLSYITYWIYLSFLASYVNGLQAKSTNKL